MKRTEKDFRKYVSSVRRMVPNYNNGRKVVVVAEGTPIGDKVIATGSRWDGYDLKQVYDRWSEAKQTAYDEAYDMYRNSRNGKSFGICSHNTFGFTVSWLHDDGMTVLTPKTEYLVIFNK